MSGGELLSQLLERASNGALAVDQQVELLDALEAAADEQVQRVLSALLIRHLIASFDGASLVQLLDRVLPRAPYVAIIEALVSPAFAHVLQHSHSNTALAHSVERLFARVPADWHSLKLLLDDQEETAFQSLRSAKLFHSIFSMATAGLQEFPEHNDRPVVELVAASLYPVGRAVLNVRDHPDNSSYRDALAQQVYSTDCRLQLLRGIPECSGHYALQSLAAALRPMPALSLSDQLVDDVLDALGRQVAIWEETEVYPRALLALASQCDLTGNTGRWERALRMIVAFLSCHRLEIKAVALQCLPHVIPDQVRWQSPMCEPLVHVLIKQTVYDDAPFDALLLSTLTRVLRCIYPRPTMLSAGFHAYEALMDRLVRDVARPNAKLPHRNCILEHLCGLVEQLGPLAAPWINRLLAECLDAAVWGDSETNRIAPRLVAAVEHACSVRMTAYKNVLVGIDIVSSDHDGDAPQKN